MPAITPSFPFTVVCKRSFLILFLFFFSTSLFGFWGQSRVGKSRIQIDADHLCPALQDATGQGGSCGVPTSLVILVRVQVPGKGLARKQTWLQPLPFT